MMNNKNIVFLRLILIFWFLCGIFMHVLAIHNSQVKLENSKWKLWCTENCIESIVNKEDSMSPVFPGRKLGDILINYKVENGMWQQLSQDNRSVSYDIPNKMVIYSDTAIGNAVVMTQKFSLRGESIVWDIELRNCSKFPILLGDVAPAFPWSLPEKGKYLECEDDSKPGSEDLFEKNFTKHQFIMGDASFLYFTRFGGSAPYYIWTVGKGTSLEYWNYPNDIFRAFIYSGKAGNEEMRGTWRQEHTYGKLAPMGENGDKVNFSFKFNSADSYSHLRHIIYDERLIDINVLPGMAIPRTQFGYFSLHTKCNIDSVVAEFPDKTIIERLGELAKNTFCYRVKFDKLGENKITIYFDNGRKTYLEYFSILSPEHLVKQRAKFLVHSQQIKDSTKWYDGLYCPFDMKNGKLLTPDKPDIYDRIRTYFIASDDPALGKAPFLASKNEVFPDDEEIASLEYYIKNFVWGGLQRTNVEKPYAYGIYGTPNWYINRHLDLKATQGNYKPGVMRAWRSFDYVHVVMLYYHMYHIAKLYPEKCHYLDAAGYLERAYQTAWAYFHYPTDLLGEYYETFKWGCYNELVIPRLIEDLEIEGKGDYAAVLRKFWERKAKYFIYDDKYPYHSEYEMDRTAFESSYSLAEYAMQYPMENDDSLWYDKNMKVWYSHPNVNEQATKDFMLRQFYANLSSRGVLEAEWNTLGSDFFSSSDFSEHSYMARMGGWAILNYALRYDENPNNWLALGYASYLNPYGVMNVGDKESNYGYWYPGKERNGAIGQAYTSQKFGRPWIGTEESRGPWRFCGEGDLGMCAVTRTATSILIKDSIFGWVYYGGNMERIAKGIYKLYPDDGVRQDLWIIVNGTRLHLKLNRDNFSLTQPLVVDVIKKKASIVIENGSKNSHDLVLTIEAIRTTKKPKVKSGDIVLEASDSFRGTLNYNISIDRFTQIVDVYW